MANGTVTTQILGIDVSSYQGTITWSQVKNTSGKLFAWAKATEGINFTDATFANNMTNGEAAGVYMGGYHFAHPETNTASAEASYFLGVASSYIKACEMPPMLDFETTGSLTGAQLTTWAVAWMNAVKSATGITPIIYTSGSIASSLGSAVTAFPLWMADPDNSSIAPPANLGVWTTWAFKQYSWTGVVSGISGNVDMDVFNGNMAAFDNLIGCATGTQQLTIQNSEFIIFPNPANDNITIENTSLDNQGEMISIYNIQGQLLFQQLMEQQKTEINVSGFAGGLYIVQIKTGNGMQVKKFVKK